MSNVFPMPHPPGCTCGCRPPSPPQPCPPGQPGWGNWGFRLRECWNEVEEFKRFIKEIIEEHGGPVRTGPIIGDITGKPAKPGEIGEFVTNTVQGTFLAASQTQSVAAIILQPGDWDIQARCFLGAAPPGGPFQLNGAYFLVSPLPTGLADIMEASDPTEYSIAAGGAVVQASGVSLISSFTQGLFSQPTLLAFQLATNFGVGGGIAGAFSFYVNARRVR